MPDVRVEEGELRLVEGVLERRADDLLCGRGKREGEERGKEPRSLGGCWKWREGGKGKRTSMGVIPVPPAIIPI